MAVNADGTGRCLAACGRPPSRPAYKEENILCFYCTLRYALYCPLAQGWRGCQAMPASPLTVVWIKDTSAVVILFLAFDYLTGREHHESRCLKVSAAAVPSLRPYQPLSRTSCRISYKSSTVKLDGCPCASFTGIIFCAGLGMGGQLMASGNSPGWTA